jgi:hypothetical protein
MYQAMTQITGDSLAQILQVMGVKTVGITTMADLLNPQKLFPNSFATLTVKTANGPRAIYSNTTGSVNTNLLKELPNYIISSTAANGPQTQPNSGTSPIDWGPIVQALKP